MKVLFAICLLIVLAHSRVSIIDDFSTPQSIVRLSRAPEFSNIETENFGYVQSTSILGGEREVSLTGNSNAACEPNAGINLVAQVQNGVDCGAQAIFRWDGTQGTAQSGAKPDGTNGVPDQGGPGNQQALPDTSLFACMTSLTIQAGSDLPTSIFVRLFTNSGVCEVRQDIPISPITAYTFPASAFTGGCNLGQITSVEMEAGVDGNKNPDLDVDVVIDTIFWECPDSADIQGTVFGDCDCNGFQDISDGPANAIQVNLGGAGCTTTSTFTDAGGNYIFSDLTPCTYTVSIDPSIACPNLNSRTVQLDGTDVIDVDFSVLAAGPSIIVPPTFNVVCDGSTDPVNTGGSAQSPAGTPTFVDGPRTLFCDDVNNCIGFSETFVRTWTVSNECGTASDVQIINIAPCPCPVIVPCPVQPVCPPIIPCPTQPVCPPIIPCPTQPVCPPIIPCPVCPTIIPCPPIIPCPVQPTCPPIIPCPTQPICPTQPTCPPCVVCPVCPTQPICPTCPKCLLCRCITRILPETPQSTLNNIPNSPSPISPTPASPSPNSPSPSPNSPSPVSNTPNSPSPNSPSPSPNSPSPSPNSPSPSPNSEVRITCQQICSNDSSSAASMVASVSMAVVAILVAIVA